MNRNELMPEPPHCPPAMDRPRARHHTQIRFIQYRILRQQNQAIIAMGWCGGGFSPLLLNPPRFSLRFLMENLSVLLIKRVVLRQRAGDMMGEVRLALEALPGFRKSSCASRTSQVPLIRDNQLDHVTGAHADLLTDRGLGAADGIGKEPH